MFKHKDLTDKIIKCVYDVYNELGYGFLEKVYENALMIALYENGLSAENQRSIEVYYKNTIVGDYRADILVDNKVVLEIKAVKEFVSEHEAQLLNYLKATKYEVGFLINFGPKIEFKRFAFDNVRK